MGLWKWSVELQFSLSFILFQVAISFGDSPVITVTEGKLRGLELYTRDGNPYYAFLGVPYASVPKRFEPPQPPPYHSGILEATNYGAACPQVVRGKVIGETEFCLFMNIFSRNLTANHSSIILYIHDGAFTTGSGMQYGASYFLDADDVVLAMFNYRLGPLGFLSTGDGVIQGNNGLLDQIMALQWIKKNGHAFGGGDRIMIMGSVAYHMLSPKSKGLFNCAISHSGSAIDAENFDPNPLEKAIDLAENLGCPTFPTTALADCLRNVDFKSIVQQKLTKWHLDPLVQFAPTVDVPRPGQSPSDLFLPEPPYTLLKEGRVNLVPYVTGITEEEGLLFHSAYVLRSPDLQRSMNQDWNYVAPITLYYDNLNIPSDERNLISRKIRGFYFGDRNIGPNTSRNLTNLYSDRLFNWGTRTTALLQAKYSPVYTYIFGFLGDFSMLQLFYRDMFSQPLVPTHGDDLQYFFNSTRFPPLRKDSRAEQVSRMLVQLWASFASTGNMLKSLQVLQTAWLPVTPEEIKRKRLKWCYIDIESKILAKDPLFYERMEFWDKTVEQLQNFSFPNASAKFFGKDEF